jgi:hypothetical protein
MTDMVAFQLSVSQELRRPQVILPLSLEPEISGGPSHKLTG